MVVAENSPEPFVNIPKLLNALKYIRDVAKRAGLTKEEVEDVILYFGDTGIDAARVGNKLREALGKMNHNTESKNVI